MLQLLCMRGDSQDLLNTAGSVLLQSTFKHSTVNSAQQYFCGNQLCPLSACMAGVLHRNCFALGISSSLQPVYAYVYDSAITAIYILPTSPLGFELGL